MEEIARTYAEALFQVAKDKGKLDAIRDQLAEFVDALEANHDLQVFFFSPYFSSAEKRDGLHRAVDGAEPELVNFLELLIEKHRVPVIFRMRRRFEEMWAEENKLLDVTVTSAVELDSDVVEKLGEEIERQTGRTVELTSEVDDSLLGGLVLQVGNMVLDASVRHRLEQLRREIVSAT
jgi:F-type H+-transporting ATPase subunit delta